MTVYNKISPLVKEGTSDFIKRIILFDPSEIYQRITINPYKRFQEVSMATLFPNIQKGFCACGCGKKLTGRQTRWHSEDCQKFPLAIFNIIRGDLGYINGLMRHYLPHECSICHCKPYVIEKNWADGIQVDHILAVKNGGGGCWLGNYRFICHRCHGKKTANDNKLRKPVLSTELMLF